MILYNHSTPSIPLSSNGLSEVRIRVDKEEIVIVSNLKKDLYQQISSQRALKYWIDKGKLFIKHPSADLSAFQYAVRNIPPKQKVQITKWMAGIYRVGKWLERQRDQLHSRCSHCSQSGEDVAHIITYSHSSVVLSQKVYMKEIQIWLQEYNALDNLAKAVIMILNLVWTSKPLDFNTDNKLL